MTTEYPPEPAMVRARELEILGRLREQYPDHEVEITEDGIVMCPPAKAGYVELEIFQSEPEE